MISGPTETPSDWMTTSIPVSARFTVAISRASPVNFSSWGWSTRILRADRGRPSSAGPGNNLDQRTDVAHTHPRQGSAQDKSKSTRRALAGIADRVGRAEGMGKPYLWRLRPEFRG